MDVSKVHIGLLEGKSNWQTWKFKFSIMLRSIPGANDVIEEKLTKPCNIPSETASKDEMDKYEKEVKLFTDADSQALLLLTLNMTPDTLERVMRFSSAREMRLELHRLYDGATEDKTYDLCMEFFKYRRESTADMASHISKLKNLWTSLQNEVIKEKSASGNTCGCDLPDLLLICKILETLPEEYFSFKSSWMLMLKSQRTVDNLTIQLCQFEKALLSKNENVCVQEQEALVTVSRQRRPIKCHYCKKIGHVMRQCYKWIADGRPNITDSQSHTNTANESQKHANSAHTIVLTMTSDALYQVSDKEQWYVDNGATNHICNKQDLFKMYEPFYEDHVVFTANGHSIKALGKGMIEIEASVNGSSSRLDLADVWYVPEIQKNLFSVLSAQDKNADSEFISKMDKCYLKIRGAVVLTGQRTKNGGLFQLNIRNVVPCKNEVNTIESKNVLQLWHERFGHQTKRFVKDILEREMNIKVPLDNDICEGCVYGKAHILKFGLRERASEPGERIHSDVCGPFEPSNTGYKYFVQFKDDFSRFRYVYFMKNKSEVVNYLKTVLSQIRTTTGNKVKEILADNGGEYIARGVKDLCNKYGIKLRLIMPYTPQQNGCAERENRTLVEMGRSLLHAREDLSKHTFLWAEMINTAAYILNRSGRSSVQDMSPYQVWYNKKPRLTHMRVIGSTCYAYVPKSKRSKIDKKALKGILIGYENDDGYRIWCENTRSLIRSRDVTIDEKETSRGVLRKISDENVKPDLVPVSFVFHLKWISIIKNVRDYKKM